MTDETNPKPQNERSFEPTGHQIVDGAIAELDTLEELSIEEQIAVLTKAVDTLAGVLSSSRNLDQTPIPGLNQSR